MSRRWLIGGGAVVVVVTLIAVAVVMLGSGDDSPPSAIVPGQEAFPSELSDEQQAQLGEFRDCLVEQGVELPEPGEGPPAGQQPSSEMLRAMQDCQQYMPEGLGPGGSPGGLGAPAPPSS